MNKEIVQKMESLPINHEAEEFLRKADLVLNAKDMSVRGMAIAPLVIAADRTLFSDYGRIYAAIVDASPFRKVTGSESFLELTFPKDNFEDEKLFYASPRIASSIRNRFYGTMLISLREFEGQDLMKSDSVRRLLGFLAENVDTIRFAFHILPGFSAKQSLAGELMKVMNITMITLEEPTVEEAYSYVVSKLTESGFVIEVDALRYIREYVIPDLNSRKACSAYSSLDAFVTGLNLELVTENGIRKQICKASVEMLLNRMEETLGINELAGIGFRV